MKFPYLKLRLSERPNDPIRPRPFIPIKLRARPDAADFILLYALLDSGADQSVFPIDIAQKLGLSFIETQYTTIEQIELKPNTQQTLS